MHQYYYFGKVLFDKFGKLVEAGVDEEQEEVEVVDDFVGNY